MSTNKEKKCIAIYDRGCYNSLKFLSNEFNIKLFDEPEDMGYLENPFGIPSYWILIFKVKLDLNLPNCKINKTPQLFVYENLITCQEFKQIPSEVTISEFYSHFAESIERRRFNDDYKNQIFKFPTDSRSAATIKPEKVIIDELNEYYYRTETRKEYIERCKSKYSTDFIYKLCLFNSCHDVEFEYREMPSTFQLKNNPNLPPIRSWKQINQVEDESNLSPLRDLVIELCNRLEENNILNYTIGLDYTIDNMHMAETQDNLTRFHNYPDPYGLD